MNETYRQLQKATGDNNPTGVFLLLDELSEKVVAQANELTEPHFIQGDQTQTTWANELDGRLRRVYGQNLPAPLTPVIDSQGRHLFNIVVTPSPDKDDQNRYLLLEPTNDTIRATMHTLQIPMHWQAIESPIRVVRRANQFEELNGGQFYHTRREPKPLEERKERHYRISDTDITIELGVRRINPSEFHTAYEVPPRFNGEYRERWRGTETANQGQETSTVSAREMNAIFTEIGVYNPGLVIGLYDLAAGPRGYSNGTRAEYRYLVPLAATTETRRLK